MRLRDASSETLKNSEPISESVISDRRSRRAAWAIVRRRIDRRPGNDRARNATSRRRTRRVPVSRCSCHRNEYRRASARPRTPTHQSSSLRAEMKTSPGTSTRPIDFIFFLPSFCFSSSLRLRVMSPP